MCVNIDFVDALDKLQASKNGELGVSCVQEIVFYLRKLNMNKAKAVWSWDGDKIRQYPDIENLLVDNLGCRTHGVLNCQSWVCKKLNK